MPRPTRASLARALPWSAVALALAAGYADLWRGGIVVAPALLTLAYVVLVPIAVLKR